MPKAAHHRAEEEGQTPGTQTVYMRGPTAGRKTTFWAPPFPNTLGEHVLFEGAGSVTSVVTSLLFYQQKWAEFPERED